MRAVIVEEFGTIDQLKFGELPKPRPRAGEVLVDIHACSVNFVDLLVISGKYQFLPQRPFAPGKLPVGIVVDLGPDVTDLKLGDRVLAAAEHGGYAEFVALPANQCHKLPAALPFADAAAMALIYDTSYFALRERARLQTGETVLVLGATGGVGLAAIQLAKAMGATVFAGISSPDKADIVRNAGADAVIDLSKGELRDSLREQVHAQTGNRGVDVVIDPVGGDIFDAAIRALAWSGRLVVIGFAAGRIPTIKANYLLVKNIEVSGLQISDYRKRQPGKVSACFRQVYDWYAAGQLKPLPTKLFPFEEFKAALHEIEDRKVRGRIVLTMK